MPQNVIACDRGQSMLLPPDLTDWVPDHHVVWSLLGAVEQMDLGAFYGSYRENGQGRPAGLFTQVLALCRKAGLVRVGIVAIDGTKISANASMDSNRSFEQIARAI